MADQQQQQPWPGQSGAERALAMLRNASKNDKATTSEDEEYSVHDSEDESMDHDLSEGENMYDPSCQPKGRRSGTRSNTNSWSHRFRDL